MITLNYKQLRLEIDTFSFNKFKDRLSGGTPSAYRGVDLRIAIGLFGQQGNNNPSDANVIDPVASDFESLTVEVKATAAATTNLMSATVTDFTTPTAANWLAGTAQHALVDFTAAQTNIAAGDKHIVISVITGAGKKITLGTSTLTIVEDGAGLDAGDPDVNPGAGLSLAIADARYVQTDDVIIHLGPQARLVAIVDGFEIQCRGFLDSEAPTYTEWEVRGSYTATFSNH